MYQCGLASMGNQYSRVAEATRCIAQHLPHQKSVSDRVAVTHTTHQKRRPKVAGSIRVSSQIVTIESANNRLF